MAIAKKINLTTSKTDLMVDVADTGVYEVILFDLDGSASYLTHNVSGTSSDSVPLSGTSLAGQQGGAYPRFLWDSATSLYVFSSSTSELYYMIVPAQSNAVNLSVGPCS